MPTPPEQPQLTARERAERAEKALAKHLNTMLVGLNLDTRTIMEADTTRSRRALMLLRAISDLVRGTIVVDHVMMDEMLSSVLREKVESGVTLTDDGYDILKYLTDHAYLSNKLELVERFMTVPKTIHNTLMALNNLRNNVAHSLFMGTDDGLLFKKHNMMALRGFGEYRMAIKDAYDFFDPIAKRYRAEKEAIRPQPKRPRLV